MSEQDNYSALRRRLAAPVLQGPKESRVVDNTGLVGRMVNRSVDNFASQFPAYAGLANKKLGDEAAARENFKEFDRLQRRARDAFELQSLDDVEAAGGKASDYAKFIAGEAVNFTPDIVSTVLPALATGFLGGGIGALRAGATKLAREAAKDLTEEAVRKAARGEMNDLAQGTAKRYIDDALKRGNPQSAAEAEQIKSQARDAGLNAVRTRMAEDRLAQGMAGVQKSMERGQRAGQFAGSTVAQSVGLSRESVDVVRDQDAEAARSVMATDLLAGSLGSVPALRLLDRYGIKAPTLAPPALRTLVPRVAKEFAAQGASESVTELAQTATQLWGHKQVMDSIDLLGPKAFDQYTSALLGGFFAGGALGAGAEGFRGVGSGVARLVGFSRDSAKQALRNVSERLRRSAPADVNTPTPSPAAQPAPAASPAAAPVPSPTPEVTDTFTKLRAQLGVNEPTPSPTAYDESEADYDTELDRLVAGASSDMKSLFEGMQQSPMQLPVRFESKMQNLLMANLDPDWSGFNDPYTAQQAAAALEKLFVPGAEITAQDDAYLSLLTDGDKPALPLDTLKKWFIVGPALGKLDEIASRTTAAAEVDTTPQIDPIDQLSSDEEAAEIARLGMSVRAAQPTEAAMTPEAVQALRRQTDTPEDPAVGRIEQLKAAETRVAELRQQGATTEALNDAVAELQILRTNARNDLLGEATYTQPFGSNVVYALPNATGKQRAAFAKKTQQPQYLAIVDPTAPEGARTAINLQNLVMQQRVRTPDITVREALVRGLSNLLDLGIKFDVNALRPFEVRGERLSPADVAAIKAQPTARRVDTPAKAPAETPFNSTKAKAEWVANRARELARAAGREPTPADRTAAVNELNARDAARFSSAMAEQMSERDIEGVPNAGDADRVRQGPRRAPGGRAETVDGRTLIVPEDAPVSVTDRGQVLPAAARNEEVDTTSPESRAERARIKDRLVTGLRRFIGQLDERRVDANDPATQVLRKLQRGQDLSDADIANVIEFIAPMIKSPVAQRALAMRVNQYFDGVQSEVAERAQAAVDRMPSVGRADVLTPISTERLLNAPLSEADVERLRKSEAEKRAAAAEKRRADDAAKRAEAARRLQTERDSAAREEAEKRRQASAESERLQTEQKMVDALTDAMGVPRVRIVDMKTAGRKDEGQGAYTVNKNGVPIILIHPKLKGRERFSVIAHELGHHVIVTEIIRGVEGGLSYNDALKLVTGTDPVASARFAAMLQAANPELYTAIKADYDKWREANSSGTYLSVRSSRATRSRAKGMAAENRAAGRKSKGVDALSESKREYLFDFHEYIADGIARAIEGNSKAQGVVAQFFKRLASQLRRLYNAIVKNNPEWRAPPSIESYVNGLFDQRRNTVSEVLQQPVSNAQAKIAVEAAAATVVASAPQTTGAAPIADINALAKYVARVMPPDVRLLIENAIERGGTTFQRLFKGRTNPVGSPALQALRERFAKDPEAVRLMDTEAMGMEYRIAGLLIMYSEQGNVGAPKVSELIRSWHDQMWEVAGRVGNDALVTQALDDALTGRINEAKQAGTLYTPADRVMSKNKARNRTLLKLTQYYDKSTEVLSRYWTGRQDRVNSFGIPALRKVMALLHRKAGSTDRVDGLIEDKVQRSYALIEAYREATSGLTDAQRAKLLDSLQNQNGAAVDDLAVDAARGRLRKLFDVMHKYMTSSGVDIPRREAFYPVRLLLDNDTKREQFRQLMNDPKFFDAMKKAFGKEGDANVTQAELVNDMEQYLTAPVDWQAVAQNTGGVPNFKSLRSRLAQFVYDLGTPEQISTFKKLQNPDMDAVMGEYILSAVNRAEFAKRFGDDGARLDRYYVEALDEGATPDQLKYVQDVVRSAVGLYALDGSPLLSKLSPQLGAIFNKRGAKEASELMLAYQNWRNLPLAVLSSATEIFGPSIRSGGDLEIAWTGLKTTVKALYNGNTRSELQALLKQMGYSQDFAIGENQQSMFGGSENSKLARSLNDTLFKWNGLTRWTTATRFGSLVAAKQFLLKHATNSGANSARYLEELNLRPGDVAVMYGPDGPELYLASDADLQQASKEEVERDARVKRALIRFVDEAVPRPNVAQTPLYYSDPAMQFVVQYKAVLYAVYQQYYKRIMKELAYGNIAPLMPALFMAATAGVAELLREAIQTAGQGDPRRAEWGMLDYAMLGAERTALVPPSVTLQNDLFRDFRMRHAEDIFVGSSQLGPSIKQALQVQSAAVGDRSAADVAESALPASALWKKWINPTEWNKETAT